MKSIQHIIPYLIKKMIEIVADILIPKEKSIINLENLSLPDLISKIPRAKDFDFETDKIKSLLSYKNDLCRQIIWEIKYRGNKTLIHKFSLLLYDLILEEIEDLKTFKNFQNIILVPVPSSRSSQKEKGFNQCVLLVEELIKIDRERNQNNFSYIPNILNKKIDTTRQSKSKNKKERLHNLKNTFTVTWPSKEISDISNYSFILIDDVITTGATMNESFRALRQAGTKKIVGFSLTH